MNTELPNRNPLNRQLAHEVVAYAEACAMYDPTEDHFEQLHHGWNSRYFEEYSGPSPSIEVLSSNRNRLASGGVILSLEDRAAVVALRIVLSLARVSINDLRRGLADEQFPPVTSAVRRLVSSHLQICSASRANWPEQACEIVGRQRPERMIIEGLRFGRSEQSISSLAPAANFIRSASLNRCGLLIFD